MKTRVEKIRGYTKLSLSSNETIIDSYITNDIDINLIIEERGKNKGIDKTVKVVFSKVGNEVSELSDNAVFLNSMKSGNTQYVIYYEEV